MSRSWLTSCRMRSMGTAAPGRPAYRLQGTGVQDCRGSLGQVGLNVVPVARHLVFRTARYLVCLLMGRLHWVPGTKGETGAKLQPSIPNCSAAPPGSPSQVLRLW